MSRTSPVELAAEANPASRTAFFVARIVLGLLWIQNSGWKTPPDFGRNAGSGLYKFTRFAVEHEVFAPYAFIVRELILPNFVVFGWLVLIVEASLGAFLLLGLATRLWALVGVAQSLAIALSVLNAPGEWSWAYYLMIAAHLAIFAAAAGRHWGLDSVLRPAWARSDSRLARLLLKAS
ncbi:MAG: TQO small subunit DoxD [Actinomycetota bacterium]|nr:TQO small subunit DoxD [Actinomycetota bacterium]